MLATLKEKQARLAAVEAHVAQLQQSYDESVNEKHRLEKSMALTEARLKRAGRLTTALGDEKGRWEVSVEVNIQFSWGKKENKIRWACLVKTLLFQVPFCAFLCKVASLFFRTSRKRLQT